MLKLQSTELPHLRLVQVQLVKQPVIRFTTNFEFECTTRVSDVLQRINDAESTADNSAEECETQEMSNSGDDGACARSDAC